MSARTEQREFVGTDLRFCARGGQFCATQMSIWGLSEHAQRRILCAIDTHSSGGANCTELRMFAISNGQCKRYWRDLRAHIPSAAATDATQQAAELRAQTQTRHNIGTEVGVETCNEKNTARRDDDDDRVEANAA